MLNTKCMITGSLFFMWLISFNTDGIVDIKTKLLKKKYAFLHCERENAEYWSNKRYWWQFWCLTLKYVLNKNKEVVKINKTDQL